MKDIALAEGDFSGSGNTFRLHMYLESSKSVDAEPELESTLAKIG